MTDPDARQTAHNALFDMFSGLGHHAAGQDQAAPASGLNAEWLLSQFQEFIEMPVELATLFINMATQLTELTLSTLEEAGLELMKGLTPL